MVLASPVFSMSSNMSWKREFSKPVLMIVKPARMMAAAPRAIFFSKDILVLLRRLERIIRRRVLASNTTKRPNCPTRMSAPALDAANMMPIPITAPQVIQR